MINLYTPKVREYVRSRNWPKGLQLDVIQREEMVEGIEVSFLQFVLYRDNWLELEPADHVLVANTIKEVMEKLRADGIQCYMERMESRSA